MGTILIAMLLGLLAFFSGVATTHADYVDKCVAKYADMPHNKVELFCRELLEFKRIEIK